MIHRLGFKNTSIKYGVGNFNQIEPEIEHLVENNDVYEPESIMQTQMGVDMYTETMLHPATRLPKYRDWDEYDKEKRNRETASALLNAQQYGSRRGIGAHEDEDYREISNKHYVGGHQISVAERKRDGSRQNAQFRSLQKRPTRTKKTKDNQIYEANFVKNDDGLRNKQLHDPSWRRVMLGPDRYGAKYSTRANPQRTVIDAKQRMEFCRKGRQMNSDVETSDMIYERVIRPRMEGENYQRNTEKLHSNKEDDLTRETLRQTKRINMTRERTKAVENSSLEGAEHTEFTKTPKMVTKVSRPNVSDFIQGFTGGRYGDENIGGFENKPGQVANNITSVPRNVTRQVEVRDDGVEYSTNGAAIAVANLKYREKNKFINPYNSHHILQQQNQLELEAQGYRDNSNVMYDNELKMRKFMQSQREYNDQATIRGLNFVKFDAPDYEYNKTQRKKEKRGFVIRHSKVNDSINSNVTLVENDNLQKIEVDTDVLRHFGDVDQIPTQDFVEKKIRLKADTTNRRAQIETLDRMKIREGAIQETMSHYNNDNMNIKKDHKEERNIYLPKRDDYQEDVCLRHFQPVVPKDKLPKQRKHPNIIRTCEMDDRVAHYHKNPLLPKGPKLGKRERIFC